MSKIRKLMAILLVVLFLVTITASAVSADTGASFTYTTYGLTASFKNTCIPDGVIWASSWNFGDGQSVRGSYTYANNPPPLDPVHTYASRGFYTVTYSITVHNKAGGYSSSTSQMIYVSGRHIFN